ncbi:MAG: hypothetical protein ACRD4S_17085 [Candidatus Acidiferrales bacterium]
MDARKRQFLHALIPIGMCVPVMLFGDIAFAWDLQQGQPVPMPGLPGQPERNPSEDENLPKIDTKLILRHNQKQIQKDVSELYTLAQQLKEQVAKTDSTNVLSLPILEKAEQIEKLAKQIRSLAHG